LKVIAKLLIATIILLYAIYGYNSGEIYSLPTRNWRPDLLASGNELIYIVLSYISFSLFFYAWAYPKKYKRKKKTSRKGIFQLLRTPRDRLMAIFFVFGFTLQIVGVVSKLFD